MKHQTEFKDGEKYVLDADFNNGSIIILVSHGDIFGKVKGDNSVWETMLNRLTEIPEWAKQYIEQSPLVDHQKQREVYIPVPVSSGELPEDEDKEKSGGMRFSKNVIVITGLDDCQKILAYYDYNSAAWYDYENGGTVFPTHWLKKATTPIVEGYSAKNVFDACRKMADYFIDKYNVPNSNIEIGRYITGTILSSLPQSTSNK